jgi:hypothetical protein
MKFYDKDDKELLKVGRTEADKDTKSEKIKLEKGQRMVGMQSTHNDKNSTKVYNLQLIIGMKN